MVYFDPRIIWLKMMGESCASKAKKSDFLVHLEHFSKFLKYFKAKLGYSWIKIDHIEDSLLKTPDLNWSASYKC